MLNNLVSFLFLCATFALNIYLLSKIIKYVVLFSKFSFAVLGAAVLSRYVTVVETNGFLNIAVMLIPLFGLCLLLNLLPRCNFSMTYLFNYLIVTLVGQAIAQAVLSKIGFTLYANKYILLLSYLICAVVSFRVLIDQVEVKKDLKNKILRAIDRLVASVINTVTLFFIILETVNFPDNVPLFVAALIVSTVLFYLADIYLFKWISPLATGRKMTSEVRHILETDWSKVFSSKGDYSWFPSAPVTDNSDWAYDEKQRRDREMMESMWAAEQEQQEYDDYQRQVESANRYYDENYG